MREVLNPLKAMSANEGTEFDQNQLTVPTEVDPEKAKKAKKIMMGKNIDRCEQIFAEYNAINGGKLFQNDDESHTRKVKK